MTKTYKINGKEIEVETVPNKKEVYAGDVYTILYQLLEAISDKEESEICKHGCTTGRCYDCYGYQEPKQEECNHEYKDFGHPNGIKCDKCLKTKKCVTCGENDHDYCTPKQSTSLRDTGKYTVGTKNTWEYTKQGKQSTSLKEDWKVGDIFSHERAGDRKLIAISNDGIYHFSMSDEFDKYGFCMTKEGMTEYGYKLNKTLSK